MNIFQNQNQATTFFRTLNFNEEKKTPRKLNEPYRENNFFLINIIT